MKLKDPIALNSFQIPNRPSFRLFFVKEGFLFHYAGEEFRKIIIPRRSFLLQELDILVCCEYCPF